MERFAKATAPKIDVGIGLHSSTEGIEVDRPGNHRTVDVAENPSSGTAPAYRDHQMIECPRCECGGEMLLDSPAPGGVLHVHVKIVVRVLKNQPSLIVPGCALLPNQELLRTCSVE